MTNKQPITPTRSGHIPVENGTRRVYWEYFGEGKKEVVVFLNGLAMLTKSWYRTIPFLHPDYDILLYDYFGQGDSSQEDEPYFINRFADYLIEVMDTAGVDKIHPIGVSYGGFVAAELGRLHQNRLHTLTLSGILLTRETLFQMYQDISLRFYHSTDEVFDIYTQYLYEKTFGENISRKIYGEAMEQGRVKFYERYKDSKHSLIRLTEAQNPFFENIDRDPDAYRNVQTPTLILTGEQDRAIPPWQQAKLLDILPSARQIMLPECGHMTYMERPDLFWPVLRKFFVEKSVNFE
ncbi:MAG: alpha/beta hydrolase [Anaerolineales bacterium]|nr:alpha/beta hydrolase [Anaerolineales bacterium]